MVETNECLGEGRCKAAFAEEIELPVRSISETGKLKLRNGSSEDGCMHSSGQLGIVAITSLTTSLYPETQLFIASDSAKGA